jgi:hypothetical protein
MPLQNTVSGDSAFAKHSLRRLCLCKIQSLESLRRLCLCKTQFPETLPLQNTVSGDSAFAKYSLRRLCLCTSLVDIFLPNLVFRPFATSLTCLRTFSGVVHQNLNFWVRLITVTISIKTISILSSEVIFNFQFSIFNSEIRQK